MNMTQEEKELVLKDICTRLPYGVRVEISWEYSKTDVYTSSEYYEFPNIDSLLNMFWDEKCISIKPYLRPLSSMSDVERNEYFLLTHRDNDRVDNIILLDEAFVLIDWLNKKGFDYRGLIPMGLAIEAKEGMYNTKQY